MSCSMEIIDMSTLSRVTAFDSELEILFDAEEQRVVKLSCRPVPSSSYKHYMGIDDSDDKPSSYMVMKNQRGEEWT